MVVLEARDRVGGRVHSYVGPFGAPVDLGASLITGEQESGEVVFRVCALRVCECMCVCVQVHVLVCVCVCVL